MPEKTSINLNNFSLRYLIKESTQKISSSWCSTGKETTTIRTNPLLQYSLDGVNWIDVLTEIEKEIR